MGNFYDMLVGVSLQGAYSRLLRVVETRASQPLARCRIAQVNPDQGKIECKS